MPAIDVDSHFEPGDSWLKDYPTLAAQVPPLPQSHRLAVMFQDLLADVPVDKRPPNEALAPPGLEILIGNEKLEGFEEATQHPEADAGKRLAWLDEVGIDVQNVICLEGLFLARRLKGSLRRDAIHACNEWLARATADGKGRLMPVAALDLTDIDAAIAELTWMRERGSRSFLLNGTPIDGIPAMHGHFDPLWSAATDLGMVPMVHIGFTPARFDPGYANTGGDMYAFRQISLSQTPQAGQVLMNAMVFGGVFERHPTLTLLFCELTVGWFPYTVEHMDSRIAGEVTLFTGKYPYPLLPSEYVRRNIRITPTPRVHQSPIPLLEKLPECVVFSSDYPHFEGSPEPTAFYNGHLTDVPSPLRDRFMFSTMADAYKQMGDPLPV
jgi:predicted TIM-barrel fold metal-dependent hydrolase